LVGNWLVCSISGPAPWALSADGIEFRTDGTWGKLHVEGSDLVSLHGIENEGDWGVDPSDHQLFDIRGNGGGYTPTPLFETSPRRLEIKWYTTTAWLVPYGP
jgi:hypothetical protein